MLKKIPGIAILIVVSGLIGLVAWDDIGYHRIRCGSPMKSCQMNLTKIDGAKDQWALENDIKIPIKPDQEDLAQSDGKGYLKTFPKCPSGKKYIINPVGTDPVCASGLPGHSLSEIGSVITTVE